MRRPGQSFWWAIFLVVAGIFLLLKGLEVFGPWGEPIWGGLYAVTGLGFLIWFLAGMQRWWRAIPGFTLLGIGTVNLLAWRGVDLGDWRGALVVLSIALGFWAVLISHPDNWWAEMPAGLLTVIGLLNGLQTLISLNEVAWLALFLAGAGLVFFLLSVVRFGQHDTRWAAIPAAALLLMGIVVAFDELKAAPFIKQGWPALLVVAGVALLILWFSQGRVPQPPPRPTAAEPDWLAPQPAPGASVTESLPDTAGRPEAARPPEPAGPSEPPQSEAPTPTAVAPNSPGKTGEATVNIYELLAQQPPDLVPPPPSAPPKSNTDKPA